MATMSMTSLDPTRIFDETLRLVNRIKVFDHPQGWEVQIFLEWLRSCGFAAEVSDTSSRELVSLHIRCPDFAVRYIDEAYEIITNLVWPLANLSRYEVLDPITAPQQVNILREEPNREL